MKKVRPVHLPPNLRRLAVLKLSVAPFCFLRDNALLECYACREHDAFQRGVGEAVPLASSSTKESQRSSFATHTGLVGGGGSDETPARAECNYKIGIESGSIEGINNS